jgi:transposase
MAYNFLRGDRYQPFLLLPDLRDWQPDEHLAWFILDVVDQLDLQPFLRTYRADGHGHPAYHPKTLLGVLLYAYCIGERSSRQIERRCQEDLAFRVLAGNQLPDHVTVARFRVRHQQALAGFLVASLRLCAAAGLVRLAVVALDGTKVAANAADRANRILAELQKEVAQILRQAAEADQAEDHQHSLARGDELPAELTSPTGRLARLQEARALLEGDAAQRQRRYAQRVAELAAAARAKGKQPRAHIKPRRRDEAPKPQASANVTDPDSHLVHSRNGWVQGYNAQAVTTCEQVVVAAQLTQRTSDLQQLRPMLAATTATLAAAGIGARPGTLLADCGYWSIANLTGIPDAPQLLIPPARHGRQGKPRKRRQAVGVAERWAARGDDRHAGQRRRQGPVRAASADHRAGLRPDQGHPWGAAVPAARAGRLRGRVEAAVRHPQPAQALAPYPQPTGTDAARHLSDREGRPCPPRRPAPTAARPRRRP